jgi:hypothetical protein
LVAKIWGVRCSLVGRFRTSRILVAFDASDGDVVALHLIRVLRPNAKIIVAHLKDGATSPEAEAFIADLRIRWSLEMRTVAVGAEPASISTNQRSNPEVLHSILCAAREAGCEVIVSRRCNGSKRILSRGKAEPPAGSAWIDPTSHFIDDDIKACIDHFRLPVCRSVRRGSEASMPIALHPELLERMRGLGYF